MITADEVLSIIENKRGYIADYLPADDFNMGQMTALAQVAEYIKMKLKKEEKVDEGYAE